MSPRSSKSPSNCQAATTCRLHLVASPAHLATAIVLVSQECRLHRLLTMYCPGFPTVLSNPTWSVSSQVVACYCCRKQHLPTLSPCCTDCCQVTLATAIRCQQQEMTPLRRPLTTTSVDSATPFALAAFHDRWTSNATNLAGSSETTPGGRRRPGLAARSACMGASGEKSCRAN